MPLAQHVDTALFSTCDVGRWGILFAAVFWFEPDMVCEDISHPPHYCQEAITVVLFSNSFLSRPYELDLVLFPVK